MSKLYVYLLDDYIGDFYLNNNQVTFSYTQKWLEGENSQALSCSLPLQKQTHTKKAESFIAGLLPEGGQKKLIEEALNTTSIYKILEAIGGECAGGVSFYKTHEQSQASQEQYEKITEENLYEMLKKESRNPMLILEEHNRLSLAGVQNKIPVRISSENEFLKPRYSSPSTHILKPDNSSFKNLVVNEYICMQLASKLNLNVAKVSLCTIKDLKYLKIERYDRMTNDQKISRLHQEDFCQALGIMPESKYQKSTGPTIKQCFQLIDEISNDKAIDRLQLLRIIIFNLLIGNNDAHGKNFSLLYKHKPNLKFQGKVSVNLAPFYDLISTVYYPDLNSEMAMKLGGEYACNNINLNHFDNLAKEINMQPSQVRKEVLQMLENIMDITESFKSDLLVQYPEDGEIIKGILTSLDRRFSFFKGRFS